MNFNNLLKWFLPVVALFGAWSLLWGYFTIVSREWVWLVLGSLSLFVICPKFFQTRAFVCLLLYVFVVYFNHFMGDGFFSSSAKIFTEAFHFLFYGAFCYYLLRANDDKYYSIIRLMLLLIIIISSITTYYAEIMFPNIIRQMVGILNLGEDPTPYYRLGVCDYSMPHAVPIIIPTLIMIIKMRKGKLLFRIISWVLIFFVLLLIWTSGATTPLLAALLAILISVLIKPHKTNRSNFIKLGVVALLVMPLMTDSVQLGIIHSLEELVPEENSNSGKLRDFESAILYGNENSGDLTKRTDLYTMSISSFANNFLFGTDDAKYIGGHSMFFDRLAALGIIGIIPLLLFLWYMFKDIYYFTPRNNRFYSLIGMACYLLIFVFKSITGAWMLIGLFVLLPVMLRYQPSSQLR